MSNVPVSSALKLAVAGPTGSGKSSAVRFLGEYPAVCAVLEPQPQELFEKFAADPRKNCYALQREIIFGRWTAERKCAKPSLVVRDRTVSEDLNVFIAMHAMNGLLTKSQCEDLAKLVDTAQRDCGLPDAFLILSASPGALRARIMSTGAPALILNNLNTQIRLYDDWVRSLRAPRIIADTSNMGLKDLRELCGWVVSTVAQACAGNRTFNDKLNLKWTI